MAAVHVNGDLRGLATSRSERTGLALISRSDDVISVADAYREQTVERNESGAAVRLTESLEALRRYDNGLPRALAIGSQLGSLVASLPTIEAER